MAYETDLLDPSWWVSNLLGNWFLAIAVIELWLLSYVRQIPNIKTISVILFSMNIVILFYAIFSGVGLTIGTGLLALVMLIYGIIIWKGEESK